MKTWGEKIWEDKIRKQGEVGVIHGLTSSKKTIIKQTTRVMKILDRSVFPSIKKGGNILDVGVGPMARFSIAFAKKGYKVVGLDISKTTLKYAKQYVKKSGVKNVTLILEDMSSFVDRNKYDLIFCIETFYHVPAHLGILTLSNFNKSLKQDGSVLVGFFIKEEKTFYQMLYELIYFTVYKLTHRMVNSYYVTCTSYTEDELYDILARTGFVLEEKLECRDRGLNLWLLKKV